MIPATKSTGLDFLKCVTSSVITKAYAMINKTIDIIPTGWFNKSIGGNLIKKRWKNY